MCPVWNGSSAWEMLIIRPWSWRRAVSVNGRFSIGQSSGGPEPAGSGHEPRFGAYTSSLIPPSLVGVAQREARQLFLHCRLARSPLTMVVGRVQVSATRLRSAVGGDSPVGWLLSCSYSLSPSGPALLFQGRCSRRQTCSLGLVVGLIQRSCLGSFGYYVWVYPSVCWYLGRACALGGRGRGVSGEGLVVGDGSWPGRLTSTAWYGHNDPNSHTSTCTRPSWHGCLEKGRGEHRALERLFLPADGDHVGRASEHQQDKVRSRT